MSSLSRHLVLLGLMLSAAGLAYALLPSQSVADHKPAIVLEKMIPRSFAGWHEEQHSLARIIDPLEGKIVAESYTLTLERSYIDGAGNRIMLSIAYGRTQRGKLQLHHPELCYPGQGFAIHSNQTGELLTAFGAIPVRRLETQLSRERSEPVTYWAIVGDHVVLDSFRRKLVEMRYGLQGQIVDGLHRVLVGDLRHIELLDFQERGKHQIVGAGHRGVV